MKKFILLLSLIACSLGAVASPTLTSSSSLPSPAYIGYWSNLNTNVVGPAKPNPTISQTAAVGYNVIVIAFGVIQGSNVSLYDNNWNNGGYGVDLTQSGFISDIDLSHNNSGAKVLLSFGGGSNSTFSWNPDINNPINGADSIITFLAANHMDGVDFDLEAGMNEDQQFLIDFISELRKQATLQAKNFPNGFFITGSPQLYTGTTWCTDKNPDDVQWNGCTTLNELLPANACNNQQCFDALDVQDYNNTQQSLTDAFSKIKSMFDNYKNNGATKIILGMPATNFDCGNGSGSDPCGYMDPTTLKNSISNISDPQFGGLMIWTASDDFTENNTPWSFINGIKGISHNSQK